jgi:Holliday junction DNA helicase RuvA subunit
MIGKLTGVLESSGEDWALVDVRGVGYLVFCSARTLERAGRQGDGVSLLVETHVREDHIHLYGFADPGERDWFRLLSTVQGVGAKMALAVLSTLSPADLIRAIAAQDKAALTRASGVGPKLAARIVAELKDKAGTAALGPAAAIGAGPGAGAISAGLDAPAEDALSALVNLGYGRSEHQGAVGVAHQGRPQGVVGMSDASLDGARVVAPEVGEEDAAEPSLRPGRLAEFVGQRQLRSNLEVFIRAAQTRGEALDHVLFHGPPGLGKTTLAQIVARELGVGFRATSGPVIARAGDLAAVLTNLEPRDVLFIDEIHRLNPAVEEVLYPAMEDYQLDLIIGEGPAARSVRIDLPPADRSAPFHAGRGDHALRTDHHAPARAIRYSPAGRLLRAR